jgi:hypothetical protein
MAPEGADAPLLVALIFKKFYERANPIEFHRISTTSAAFVVDSIHLLYLHSFGKFFDIE